MSDTSSLSDEAIPSDGVIESELRSVVQSIYKSGNLDELTVKRVRSAAEKNLGLNENFLKDPAWKDRSKDIIEAEANDAANSANMPASSPPSKSEATSKSKKRSSPDDAKPQKRRKINNKATPELGLNSEPETKAKSATAPPRKRNSKTKVESSGSELSEPEESKEGSDENQDAKSNSKAVISSKETKEESESEMSEVIDDEPKVRGRKRKSDPKAPRMKEVGKKQKSKSAKSPDLDPDAEEIKRLQGWLIKCGIRKMWARELKPYDTPKAKIRHLKELLSDAGMTGRYSKEKAEQIKEARELQADLEAVTEGAKYWGKSDEDKEEQEEIDESKPRRRLARGLENLDFLNDDDGEETD